MTPYPAHLVLIEDNEATRYAVSRILTSAGFRVSQAENGETGLRLVATERPDLVLLDVKLPDVSGFEIVRRLKSDPALATIPVVHLSATSISTAEQVAGLEGGADLYLTHPVDPRVLVATLDALLRARRAEARYRRLFDTGLLGIVSWGPGGVIVDANAAFLRLAARARAEVLSGALRWEALASAPPPAARAGAPREMELIRPGGERVPVLVGRAEDDGRESAVAFVLDISEQKRAEEALREADRRKNEFLGVLSHELRNPLAPIRNSVAILRRVPPDGEQAARARDVIGRQAEHLARLVDDLLDVTRIARGKIQLRAARVDLAELARRTIEDHAGILSRDGIQLDVTLPAAPIWVDGDPTRLAQVLGNLVGNAAKFSNAGGRVSVSLEAGHAAVLRVRDEGIGMTPEMLQRLFVPFAQADESLARTRSRGGLGLGLALVKMLVELHGGEVEAHSGGLGQGAEFVVRLPIAARAAVPRGAAGGQAAPGRRILVVEDNPDAGETLRELLGLEGHEVRLAASGEEALAVARSFRPDVVLCDLGLPGMDGFAFARAARADPALGAVSLVALSGYAHEAALRRAEEAGFARHIRKPATLDELRAAVAEAGAGAGAGAAGA